MIRYEITQIMPARPDQWFGKGENGPEWAPHVAPVAYFALIAEIEDQEPPYTTVVPVPTWAQPSSGMDAKELFDLDYFLIHAPDIMNAAEQWLDGGEVTCAKCKKAIGAKLEYQTVFYRCCQS